MAEPGMDDEDLFADLYDGDDTANDVPATAVKVEVDAAAAAAADDFLTQHQQHAEQSTEPNEGNGFKQEQSYDQGMDNNQQNQYREPEPDHRPLIGSKEDGKMFIGGLNWETTDQSLKDYFSQFGEVVECTVMRDGATGRSRGFGFLTFRDPKTVNTVMVKEHSLDGKLIDPKRAIPRDEQERTAKIFVGGVSQDATEQDFEVFFQKFGRVLDATLMMDKDTGRPRGFGFVTFDNEMAVERTLEGPLSILGKPIEVKRAQPRGKMDEENANGGRGGFGGGRGGRGGFGGGGRGDGGFGNNNNNQMAHANAPAQDGGNPNNMTPAMMAQYWQRMQQYFAQMQAMQQGGGMGGMMGGGMNPMMMQQMQAMRGGGQMNPQMMQQMMAMQQQQQGGGQSPMNGNVGAGRGTPNNNNNGNGNGAGQQQQSGAFSAQDQLMFEQQKYERQTMARMQGQHFGGQNTWDGMYDGDPPPDGMAPHRGGGGGGFSGGGRGGRGGGGGGNRQGSAQPHPPPANAPAGAPTGPKNAGRPGANYRGGGRGGGGGGRGGGGGGFHPYARGSGGNGN